MAPYDQSQGPFFKIKLSSGRVLGPLDLERVRRLVLKNQIVGSEVAREHPHGEWMDINLIPALSEVLIAKVQGKLEPESPISVSGYRPILGQRAEPGALPGATQILPATVGLAELPELESDGGDDPGKTVIGIESGEAPVSLEISEEEEKTRIVDPNDSSEQDGDEATPEFGELELLSPDAYHKDIANEKTVMFQRSTDSASLPGKRPRKLFDYLKVAAVIAAVGLVLSEFSGEAPIKTQPRFVPIRPKLPSYSKKADPQISGTFYQEAMRHYVADNVVAYRAAAGKLLQSAAADITNVKSLAMLASSYLNLIDSSNKDGDYFAVISKLIEMSRAKGIDVPETVIADVEFYITANKAEAAESRIVEYTKTHQNYGLEMFYYLGLAYFHRGDFRRAASFVGQYPDDKAFSPKIFYLRGQIAEKLMDTEAALREYNKAVVFNKEHVRSRLRIAALLHKRGNLKDAAKHLEFITSNAGLSAPKDLAQAYYLHGLLSGLNEKWDIALGDIERAVKLDKDNHDYLLELYTLRAKVGDSVKSVRSEARMYFFLGEGERLLKEGRYNDALTQFLQARQSNDDSPTPLIKIGDMFLRLNDLGNASMNYKLAATRAPNSIEVWSKYMDVLIQSYEWEEAQKAMARFRNLPVPQSAIDKAAADMYEKQGRHVEAQAFYKKAMARDAIDPGVYLAFAKSLMSTRHFKEAPFFFALALRFDPLNLEAIVGTAKCIAATDSIPRAINMLQDELQKSKHARSELLAAIAEFHIQAGNWDQAKQNIEQAMGANPDYAYPWKLQAQVYLNREGLDRDALERALLAYQSYSERNSSDPSGYLERYKIFIKKVEFEKAGEELRKIYGFFPKYPNLHYYQAALYTAMGNHKAAVSELKIELTNNPESVSTMIAYGKSLLEVGQIDEALGHFNKAMIKQPSNADAKQSSAYANYLLKNYQGAVALFQAALALDRGNPLVYKRLGMAYREMGDGAGAAQAFRKYLEMEPDASDRHEFERYK